MAATTFNVDTPLYVTGVVARRGIAGNWEWWSFAFTHQELSSHGRAKRASLDDLAFPPSARPILVKHRVDGVVVACADSDVVL